VSVYPPPWIMRNCPEHLPRSGRLAASALNGSRISRTGHTDGRQIQPQQVNIAVDGGQQVNVQQETKRKEKRPRPAGRKALRNSTKENNG